MKKIDDIDYYTWENFSGQKLVVVKYRNTKLNCYNINLQFIEG